MPHDRQQHTPPCILCRCMEQSYPAVPPPMPSHPSAPGCNKKREAKSGPAGYAHTRVPTPGRARGEAAPAAAGTRPASPGSIRSVTGVYLTRSGFE